MKALTIPASRVSISGCMRSISATVSQLVKRPTSDVRRATLTTAITAIVCLFACLGSVYVPGIIVSGLTALISVIIAPMGDIDAKVDREGGAA